jgi:DNA-binding CsgD family transcriptional regulator
MVISEAGIGKVQNIGHELLEVSNIDEFRSEAINRLSSFFSASTSAFFHWAGAGRNLEHPRREDVHFWQLDPEYQDLYFERAFKTDPLMISHRRRQTLPRVATLHSVASQEELKANPLFRQILLPNNQHDVLSIYFVIENQLLGHISLTRCQNALEFGAEDIRLAQLLAPFLTAAYSRLLLKQQILNHESIAGVLASLCSDRICMILNESGELVYTNADTVASADHRALSHPRILESLRSRIRLPTSKEPLYTSVSLQARCWDMGVIRHSMEDQRGRALGYALRHRVIQHGTELFHLLSPDSSDNMRPASTPVNHYGLTPRERDVIAKVKEGLNSAEIGEQLSISRWTVKNHLQSIYSKVGVNSRVSLVKHFH